MGQSLVRWLVSLPWYMQYGVLLCVGVSIDHDHDLDLRPFGYMGGDLWSKVPGFLSYGDGPKFFSQFSGGLQPSELMLCIGLG
jgi:hypothetical protein